MQDAVTMMDGMGGSMAAGPVFMLIILGLAIVAGAWLVHALRGRRPALPPDRNGPREILQERYASGEIDEDEYFRRIAGLEQT